MTALFLSVALKGAAVLAVAFLALRLLRDAPAALRHGVWTAAFAALLLLPVLDAFGPAWRLPVLPSPSPQVTADTDWVVAEILVDRVPSDGLSLSERSLRSRASGVHAPGPSRPLTPYATESSGDRLRVTVPRPSSAPLAPMLGRGSTDWAGWLLGVWALGAFVVGLRWLAAYASAAFVVRSAARVTDDDWLDAAEHARRVVGVRGEVRLLQSGRLSVPVAWGYGQPAVVLPAAADGWGEARREAVLLHEMAHLRRADARTQVVAQLAVALHWVNPLAWLAYRRFLAEREHACDDAVLSGGAAPSDYAGHLVEIARGARRHEALALSAVSPMARGSDLEGRVRSILDAGRHRAAAGGARLGGTVALGLLLAAPLGALRPVAAAADAPAPSPVLAVPSPPAPPTPPAPPAAPAQTQLDAIVDQTIDQAVTDALGHLSGVVDEAVLDTIPRAEAVLGPALDAALRDIRRMRADGLGLSDDAWDEIEGGVRDAFATAREDYDEAVAEAVEAADWHDALADAEHARAEATEAARRAQAEALDEARQARASARAEMADAVAARTLRRGDGAEARRAADRAARASQRALREAERREADLARQSALREAQRERQRELQRQQRDRERALREAQRARQRALREAQRRSQRSATQRPTAAATRSGFAFSVGTDGASVSLQAGDGVGAWMAEADALDAAANAIAASARELRADGRPAPNRIAGLRAGLAGLDGALGTLSSRAKTWARSDTERGIARARLTSSAARLHAARESVDACEAVCDTSSR